MATKGKIERSSSDPLIVEKSLINTLKEKHRKTNTPNLQKQESNISINDIIHQLFQFQQSFQALCDSHLRQGGYFGLDCDVCNAYRFLYKCNDI